MQLSEKGLRIWQVPGHDVRIEFRESVLEALRITALKQLATGAKSFAEKRGELFGTREGATIHPNCAGLLSSQPTLETANSVVGWYAIRTAKDIFLSEEDVKYLNQNSGNSGNVALIVRPGTVDASIRIGVFFREADGHIRSASSYGELLVKAPTPPALPMPLKPVRPNHPQSSALELEAARSVVPISTQTPVSRRLPNHRVPLAVGSLVAAIFVMITYIEIRAMNKRPKPQTAPSARPAAQQTPQTGDHTIRVSRANLETSGER